MEQARIKNMQLILGQKLKKKMLKIQGKKGGQLPPLAPAQQSTTKVKFLDEVSHSQDLPEGIFQQEVFDNRRA